MAAAMDSGRLLAARAVATWDETVTMPIKSDVRAELIVNAILQVLVIGIVVARLVARRVVQAIPLGTEDYLAVAATVFNMGVFITTSLMAPLGSGYPLEEDLVNLGMVLLITFIMQPLYIMTLALVKLSMLFLYVRLFSTTAMILASRILMGVVVLWAVAHYLAAVFICDPVAAQYDLTVQGTCGDQTPLFVSLIATNIIIDIAMMVIPLKTIWQLKLRKTEKLGIMASFAISIAIVVIGIFRIVYVTTVDLANNITGTMPVSIFLTAFETSIAVICVSIPSLRPYYTSWRAKHHASRITESTARSRSDGHPASRYAHGSKNGLQDEEVELGIY